MAKDEAIHTLIFLGHPGAGKGTQAYRLSIEYGFKYFEMGGILRKEAKEGTERGRMIDEMINEKAQMVPDEMVNEIIDEKMSKLGADQNVILDSHPRNVGQMEKLDEILERNGREEFLVFFIDVSDEEARRRLLSRRICSKCSNVTMVDDEKPEPIVCDACGGEMMKRRDDTPEKIAKRQGWSHENVDPIVREYKKRGALVVINGEQAIEKVYKDIVHELRERKIVGDRH